jgi:hypothetical protein
MATGFTRFVGGIVPKKSAIPGKVPTGTTGNEINLLKFGEIASNLSDRKLWGFDGTNVFEYGSKSYLALSGGTVSGDTNFSANLSATTFFSAGTPLETIIQNLAGAGSGDITRVQPGLNITTGGTPNNPIISTVESPTFDVLTITGLTKATALIDAEVGIINSQDSKVTIFSDLEVTGSTSATTLFSGSTNLDELFYEANEVIFSTTSPPTDKIWIDTSSYTQFIYDSGRSKWLTGGDPILVSASRNSTNVTNQYLRHYNGTPYNLVPYSIPYDCTITQINLRGQDPQTWQAVVATGTGLSDIIFSLDSGGTIRAKDDSINIDLGVDADLYIYCSGTSIDYPRVDVYFKRRGE